MRKKSRTSTGSESAGEAEGPRMLIGIKLCRASPWLRSILEIQREKCTRAGLERTVGRGVSADKLCGLMGLPKGFSSSASAS